MSKNQLVYTLSLVDSKQPTSMQARITHFTVSPDNQKHLHVKQYHGFLGIYFNLWNGFHYCIEGMQRDIILSSSFNIVYLPRKTGVVYFLKKGNYKTLAFHFSIDFLNVWRNDFPFLNNFLKNVKINRPAFLSPYHLSITTEMFTTILYILNNQYTGPARDIYLRGKTYEILELCLKAVKAQVNRSTSKEEPVKIKQVHDYILHHLNHHCDVDLLATMVEMDKRKLSADFKRVYKTTIIDFWMDARMKKAKSLLKDTTWTIKEIAKSIGYKTQSNFTDIFKKKFGLPPIAVRNLYHVDENSEPKGEINE